MRGDNHGAAPGLQNAMKLFHQPDHIRYVLDDMNGAHLTEGTVAERIRRMVQVGNDVGARTEIAIEPDGSGMLIEGRSPHLERADGFGLTRLRQEVQKLGLFFQQPQTLFECIQGKLRLIAVDH